ncbi:hypothetical protein SARC_08558 [Sphaeroforma arctica JP610]|uniref:Uncharacterized protein n=1 Tax=Sphaeroforma arctica JP610 TaxID=667725 RepID=A0A0L0FQH7_9EUKA|nr:hypothetical protein SARC_08558 [Sphaeroforma arctica JP610]KNC79032.1 hypothetical protein SARC_08558 [Sphaeroforma arctica JP610]|eukprot:XP_014152934.1 hypothetical protein SARC_08558 [Sphaeroforma arctica JP610]
MAAVAPTDLVSNFKASFRSRTESTSSHASQSSNASEVNRPTARRMGGVTTAIQRFEQDLEVSADAGKYDGTSRVSKKFVLGIFSGDEEGIQHMMKKDGTIVLTTELMTQLPMLHLAISKSDPIMIKELLGCGYYLEMKSLRSGDTPLHHAARLGKQSIVSLLLEAGACSSAQNYDGLTYEDLLEVDDWESHYQVRDDIVKTTPLDRRQSSDFLSTKSIGEKKNVQGRPGIGGKKGFFKRAFFANKKSGGA